MDVQANGVSTSDNEHSKHIHMEGFQHWIEGVHVRFPRFKHEHPPVIDVNKVADERLTLGQRIADGVAATMGSWPFIIIQSIILAIWITLNTIQLFFKPFDQYPFILLNLMLSFQAAYAAPIIMMSQNRQAAKDRLTAESDYHTNVKSEEEIRNVMEHLDHQDMVILQIVQHLEAQNGRLMQQEKLTFELVQHLEAQNELMKTQHQEMLERLPK